MRVAIILTSYHSTWMDKHWRWLHHRIWSIQFNSVLYSSVQLLTLLMLSCFHQYITRHARLTSIGPMVHHLFFILFGLLLLLDDGDGDGDGDGDHCHYYSVTEHKRTAKKTRIKWVTQTKKYKDKLYSILFPLFLYRILLVRIFFFIHFWLFIIICYCICVRVFV